MNSNQLVNYLCEDAQKINQRINLQQKNIYQVIEQIIKQLAIEKTIKNNCHIQVSTGSC